MGTNRVLSLIWIAGVMTLVSAYSAFGTSKVSATSEPIAKSGCCPTSGTTETTDAGESQDSSQEIKSAFANTRCPIMGGAIDPANVTPELTREYKGQKVAFCCGGCPSQWDKLSDQEKDARLRNAQK